MFSNKLKSIEKNTSDVIYLRLLFLHGYWLKNEKNDLPVYLTKLSVLDFLELGADGAVFLTGGGLYPGGL